MTPAAFEDELYAFVCESVCVCVRACVRACAKANESCFHVKEHICTFIHFYMS